MRISTALLSALHVAGTALCAQQTPGRVFNPRANPANPDVVAFERLDNDRRELQIMSASSGEVVSLRKGPAASPPGVIGLPDLPGGTALSVFSGDLDWRPRIDDGNYWFTYVASDERGLGLFLNYLDRDGRLASTDPVRIPFSGNVRGPRWSPDGRHIAFVSDSGILHVVPDADAVARAGNATRARVMRISQASVPALFPEWSPAGDHIAYQVEKVIRGEKKHAIEVLPVNPRSGAAAGTSVSVTDGLSGENAYRPSWSPDGRYIAFYVDRSGQRGTESQFMDIGVVEAQKNPSNGQVFRGELREGRSRRIAESVISNQSRGPSWTRIGDASQQPQLAIAYAQKDEARNNPLKAVGLQRWLDLRPREEFEVALSQGWGTSNHKDVVSTEMSRTTRYVYVSVEGGGENVRYRDVPAPWASGVSAQTVSVAPKNQTMQPVAAQSGSAQSISSHSVFPEALFPGGAQLSSGKPVKGLVLAAGGLGGIAYGLIGVNQIAYHNSKIGVPGYDPQDESDRVDAWKPKVYASFVVAALSWGYGILDARSNSASSNSLRIGIAPIVSGHDGSLGGQLSIRVPVGTGQH